jgi:hypothetical protein
MNILPREYRRRGLRWRAILPWLLLIALVVLLVPSSLAFLNVRYRYREAEEQLALAQTALKEFEPIEERKGALEEEIEAVQTQAIQIEAAARDAVIQHIRWSDVISMILAAAPEGLQIEEMSQTETQMTLQGTADSHLLPLAFSEVLTDSDPVKSTTIESLDRFRLPSPEGEDSPEDDPPSHYRFEITMEIQP